VPAVLKIAGEVAAGTPPAAALHPGEAICIMTGARISDGSDAGVQQEWTTERPAGYIEITRGVPEGHNIRKAGADLARGAIALQQGTRIRPQEIGLLASMGRGFVEVYRQPAVAILATGNELVDIDRMPGPGKIR